MIGEEKYYGAISADSPSSLRTTKNCKMRSRLAGTQSPKYRHLGQSFIQSLGRTQARMSADYE